MSPLAPVVEQDPHEPLTFYVEQEGWMDEPDHDLAEIIRQYGNTDIRTFNFYMASLAHREASIEFHQGEIGRWCAERRMDFVLDGHRIYRLHEPLKLTFANPGDAMLFKLTWVGI